MWNIYYWLCASVFTLSIYTRWLQVASFIREHVETLKNIKTQKMIYMQFRLNEFLQENKTLESVFDLSHENLIGEVFTVLNQVESFMGFNFKGRQLLEKVQNIS